MNRFKILNSPQESQIMILDEISEWTENTTKEFARKVAAIPSSNRIKLVINSPGGSVFQALGIYNLIQPIAGRIQTEIIGMALSCGSWIGMSASKVTMRRNALMMIHNPNGYAAGEKKDMESAAEALGKVKDVIVQIYVTKTGKSDEEIIEMMDKETWMTAEDALEHGFIDEISEDEVEFGEYKLSNLQKILPEGIYNTVSEWIGKPKKPADLQPENQFNTSNKFMKSLLKYLVENGVIKSADADEADIVLEVGNFLKTNQSEITNLKNQLKSQTEELTNLATAAAEVAVNSFIDGGVITNEESDFWVQNYLSDREKTLKVLSNRKAKMLPGGEPLNLGGSNIGSQSNSELDALQNAYDKETDSWKRGEIARKISKLKESTK